MHDADFMVIIIPVIYCRLSGIRVAGEFHQWSHFEKIGVIFRPAVFL